MTICFSNYIYLSIMVPSEPTGHITTADNISKPIETKQSNSILLYVTIAASLVVLGRIIDCLFYVSLRYKRTKKS